MHTPLTRTYVETHHAALISDILAQLKKSRSKHKDVPLSEFSWSYDFSISCQAYSFAELTSHITTGVAPPKTPSKRFIALKATYKTCYVYVSLTGSHEVQANSYLDTEATTRAAATAAAIASAPAPAGSKPITLSFRLTTEDSHVVAAYARKTGEKGLIVLSKEHLLRFDPVKLSPTTIYLESKRGYLYNGYPKPAFIKAMSKVAPGEKFSFSGSTYTKLDLATTAIPSSISPSFGV